MAIEYFILFAVVYAQNSCYYAADKRAGSAIIPCGGSGYSSCCQIGDLCLSDSACWNPTYNVTYLYGCSDSTYQDPSCPWKCGPDFESSKYVGLDYCYNTTKNEWACTHPPSNSDSIQPNPPQECVQDSIIAFAGPNVLQPILSLPTDAGGSTVWFSEINPTSYSLAPGYTPTTTSIVVTASVPTSVELISTSSSSSSSSSITSFTTSHTTSSSAAPVAGVTPSQQTTTPTPTPSSGLSTGAKVGIGVGVAGGVLGLLGLGLFLFMWRKRRSTPQREEHKTLVTDPSPYLESEKKPRPLSELPSNTSQKSNWDSPAPTYTPNERRNDTIHELP